MKYPRERREEARQRASGLVHLELEETGVSCEGQLVDVSPSGFRARTGAVVLQTGQHVRFRHSGMSGEARVAWTRATVDLCESGFHITACQ